MKSRFGIQVVLIFLAMAVSGFDRHLSNYFPGEVNAMIQCDAFPAHADLPVKSGDFHEDISLKTFFCAIPVPHEASRHEYLVLSVIPGRKSPHTIWQPPEHTA